MINFHIRLLMYTISFLVIFSCQQQSIETFADKIIYHTKDYYTHIAVMDEDGSNKVELTEGRSFGHFCDISSDGKKIIFSINPIDVGPIEFYCLDAETMKRTKILEGQGKIFSPRFSPDGSKLVYKAKTDDDYDIFSINTDGSGKIQLTDNDLDDRWPVYSPDGAKILFCRGDTKSSHLYIMDSDGSNQVALTDPLDSTFAFFPEISPDGSKIMCEVNPITGRFEILLMDFEGSNQQVLENENKDYGMANFSPDGSMIVFVSGFMKKNESDIMIYDIENGNLIKLTQESGEYQRPRFSRGGDSIVYSMKQGKISQIYSINIESRKIKQLTRREDKNYLPFM